MRKWGPRCNRVCSADIGGFNSLLSDNIYLINTCVPTIWSFQMRKTILIPCSTIYWISLKESPISEPAPLSMQLAYLVYLTKFVVAFRVKPTNGLSHPHAVMKCPSLWMSSLEVMELRALAKSSNSDERTWCLVPTKCSLHHSFSSRH